MKRNKLKAIDLFCGAGGLTAGLKKAGFNVLAGFEIDEVAAETYKSNHKRSRIFVADISSLSPLEVMVQLGLKKGELDLLAGCPPCQGFSSHKTRNKSSSVDDDRNNLIFSVLDFIEVMEPKTIMIENVPGLAKDSRIEKFKKRLGQLGYKVDEKTVQVLNAADYGVPQRRKRMILQASRFGFIPEPKKLDKHKTVKQAIGHLAIPGASGDILHDLPVVRTEKVNQIIKHVPKNGGSRSDLPKELWLSCHLKRPGSYRDVYGRMAWGDVSPTITGGCISPSKGRFIHPEQDRAITLREAALLQTFPGDYKFSLKKGRDFAALMIGNALPPVLICAHAKQFKAHLESLN